MRDAAYGILIRPARRDRHASTARYLEGVLGENVRDFDVVLAHHWREGGDSRRAIHYLLLAARRAADAWAEAAAVDLYRTAADLAGDDETRRTTIRLKRALARVQLSNFDAGAAEIDQLLPSLTGSEEVDALLARAWSAYWLEESADCVRYAERARELAERLGDPELLGPAMVSQALASTISGEIDRVPGLYQAAQQIWVPGTRGLGVRGAPPGVG